ncbi:MAG: 2-aminoethylphosphonate--pyruvate transaminase [Epulopiscium sp. Nele67-Bin004]|nr:MAG: 2-aminoethylphosphonate--pyruvate transaminase [Epulopiscium sp. Nele67-Bin004]
MKNYKLLTPGPLTTTQSVKEEMLFDHCTWDADYKDITQHIRAKILEIANIDPQKYTVVLMQGSGTFGVEAVVSSVIGKNDKCLFLSNGAYGERIIKIADYNNINYSSIMHDYDTLADTNEVQSILENDASITHVMMVHCETTTGILNDIEAIGQLCKQFNKTFIVDAMSSFGGIEIDFDKCGIDFLVSSSNKCIQGVPGFSFIISNKELLIKSKGTARSLSLDLYDQWAGMDEDGKWRFTSPTHSVLAFAKAISELEEEGGIVARQQRYTQNQALLIERMANIGINAYVPRDLQSPIITTFLYDDQNFSFLEMYEFIKDRGFAIYPGKLMDVNTFRIGNIGEIYPEDITKLCDIFEELLQKA